MITLANRTILQVCESIEIAIKRPTEYWTAYLVFPFTLESRHCAVFAAVYSRAASMMAVFHSAGPVPPQLLSEQAYKCQFVNL